MLHNRSNFLFRSLNLQLLHPVFEVRVGNIPVVIFVKLLKDLEHLGWPVEHLSLQVLQHLLHLHRVNVVLGHLVQIQVSIDFGRRRVCSLPVLQVLTHVVLVGENHIWHL